MEFRSSMESYPAPPLSVSEWLNTDKPLILEELLGRVVVIEAFQMLCPGCVSHGLPQAQRIARLFSRDQVTVIGLHTVFEHHEAQGSRAALKAFAHEYNIRFPLGIDKQGGYLPVTMSAYDMQGTPTLVIIDKQGNLRFQGIGQVEDLMVGKVIGGLLAESAKPAPKPDSDKVGCSDGVCLAARHPST